MVHELDVQVRIDGSDQLAEGGAIGVQRHVGHGGEGRLQGRKALGGGAGTGELFLVQGQGAVLVIDRHQGLVEMAAGNGRRRALLAFQGEGVDIGAGDAFEGGDGVGADALVRLGMAGAQAQVAAVHQHRAIALAGAASGHGHHFGAAGDHQVFHARHDGVGREVHRGDARATEAVQGHARRLDVIAGVEGRHAAQVAALRATLAAGAPDDVVDFLGLEVVAFGQGLENRRAQLLGMDLGQGSLADLADPAGGPDGVDDQGFGHGVSSCRDRVCGKLCGF